MSRTCGYCKGSGGRTRYYKSYGEQKEEWIPCKVCGGSGDDPNWRETQCKILSCRAIFEYNIRWTNIPEYCEECRKPQYKKCPHCGGWIEYRVWWDKIPEYCRECYTPKYKECKNPDCRHQIKYYVFWDNIPDYCRDCKGWRYKRCANSHCQGEVRFHDSWARIPNYCNCRGYYEKECENPGCTRTISVYCEWKDIPHYCKECREEVEESRRKFRSGQLTEEVNMKRLLSKYPELKNNSDLQNKLHLHLQHYVRGVDKPVSYEELESAYLEIRS